MKYLFPNVWFWVSSLFLLLNWPWLIQSDIGEQSTGKSSVIEAISGIKTPRSTDTCTRCPLFIKLESTEPRSKWLARVYLRKEHRLGPNVSRGKPRFPGWSPSDCSEVEFTETDSPAALEDIISRAQLAILSDTDDPKGFARGSIANLERYRQADFSPNIVCISISGPGLPDLSFYDLPGIIAQAENESTQFLVNFVENLVTDYVKDEEALLLVTCSLTNDIHNSRGGQLARHVKATGRCVGSCCTLTLKALV